MEDDFTPFKRWLKGSLSRERRRAEREEASGVVAHFWDGAAPVAHSIRDISTGGLYLLTERRWYPGTLVMLTLQRKNGFDDEAGRSITVQSKVVRSGPDGVALSFVTAEDHSGRPRNGANGDGFLAPGRKAVRKFLDNMRSHAGQSLIEFALVLPIILVLIVNLVNFGAFFYAWITVSNAARAGADFAIMGGASVASANGPTPASAAQIASLIQADIFSLPNHTTQSTINVCQSFNGSVSTLSGTCTSVPADPEPANYVLTVIDVTYTYRPLIPAGFQFQNLNVYATIPSSTIHRRAVMRMIQ